MRGLLRRIRRRVRPAPVRPLILMYHRIARPRVDPWGLAVSPDHFEAHLQYFASGDNRWRCQSSYTGSPRARSRATPSPSRSTTATSTTCVKQNRGWPQPDTSDGLRDGGSNPAAERVLVGRGRARVSLRAACASSAMCPSAANRSASRSRRPMLTSRRSSPGRHGRIRGLTGSAATSSCGAACRGRRQWNTRPPCAFPPVIPAFPPPDAGDLPLSPSEVAEIAADGLIEVGGHTVTHPVLPSIPPAERRREILDGRRCCERLVNGRVTGFAYPPWSHGC